jgi:hypothetical protein
MGLRVKVNRKWKSTFMPQAGSSGKSLSVTLHILDLDDFLALRTTRRACTVPVHIIPLLPTSELLFCVSTSSKYRSQESRRQEAFQPDNNDRTLTFAVKFEDHHLRVIGLLSI